MNLFDTFYINKKYWKLFQYVENWFKSIQRQPCFLGLSVSSMFHYLHFVLYVFLQYWHKNSFLNHSPVIWKLLLKTQFLNAISKYIVIYNYRNSFDVITTQKLFTIPSYFKRSVPSVDYHSAFFNIFQKLYLSIRLLLFVWVLWNLCYWNFRIGFVPFWKIWAFVKILTEHK